MKKLVALFMVAMMLLSSGALSIAEEETEEIPVPAAVEPAAPAEEPAAPAEEPAAPAEEPAAPAEEPAAPAEEPAAPAEEPAAPAEESAAPAEEPAEEPAAEEEPAEEPAAEEPAAEEEPAEEPEETEEDPMAVIEVPEELEEEFTGSITVSIFFEGDELYYGDVVTLRAVVRNANLPYTIRWEANAGGDWFKVGSGNSYGFVVNESNATMAFRAVLVVAD